MSDEEKEDRKNRLATVAIGFVNYLHARGYSIGEATHGVREAGYLECCASKRIARLIAEFSNDYG